MSGGQESEQSPPPVVAGAGGKVKEKESASEYVQREYKALKPFVIISSSYLLFTITDGAVRMIVLLHAYNKSFSAWEVALMFTLYEAGGVFTNLIAGVAGSRWGIKATLVGGLCLQIAGLSALYGWQDDWSKKTAIVYVTLAQMLCGVAKDLTKLGGKTVTKLVTPEEKQNRLFKIVSFITGFKNSLKGAGYFLGAALLNVGSGNTGYRIALGVMLFLIVAALPWAVVGLDKELGRTDKKITLAMIFKKNYNVNVLSLARMFLFGSRDLWFEVPLPFFLRDARGLGWDRPAVGAMLGLWIIFYGQVQSWSPQLVLSRLKQSPPNKYHAAIWAGILVSSPVALGCVLQFTNIFEEQKEDAMAALIIAGLAYFAFVFAVNSSVHSYLVVKYAEGNKVAMNVGFYYMSNAMGRLTGTLVSGALYDYTGGSVTEGLANCFWASVSFAAAATVITMFLDDDKGGANCGSCFCIGKEEEGGGEEV